MLFRISASPRCCTSASVFLVLMELSSGSTGSGSASVLFEIPSFTKEKIVDSLYQYIPARRAEETLPLWRASKRGSPLALCQEAPLN